MCRGKVNEYTLVILSLKVKTDRLTMADYRRIISD